MRDNDKEIVVTKFWNKSDKLLRSEMMDQMIMLCALLMTVYNDKIEFVNTDETTLEVSKIYYWPTGSHYGILGSDRSLGREEDTLSPNSTPRRLERRYFPRSLMLDPPLSAHLL